MFTNEILIELRSTRESQQTASFQLQPPEAVRKRSRPSEKHSAVIHRARIEVRLLVRISNRDIDDWPPQEYGSLTDRVSRLPDPESRGSADLGVRHLSSDISQQQTVCAVSSTVSSGRIESRVLTIPRRRVASIDL